MPLARVLPLTTDCSGFVTLCYYLAGAPDPNGLGYSGQGWTGTLLRHLPATDAPRPGDIVVFGAYPGRHCAIALTGGPDPLLASHGMERGPVAIRFSAETAIQRVPATWLSLEAAARTAGDQVAEDADPDGGGGPPGGQRPPGVPSAVRAPRPDGEADERPTGDLDDRSRRRAPARLGGEHREEEEDGAGAAEDGEAEHDERRPPHHGDGAEHEEHADE